MKSDKLKQLYFSHDIYADKDEKIIKMFYYFKKNINEFSEEFLKKNFFHASFGLFWEIIQYLHRNELTVDEIPMLADELRADENFVRLILEEFRLFRVEDNKIVSERVLKNLKLQKEKSEKARQSANKRYKGKKEGLPKETEQEIEYDEQTAMSIIRIYNEKFNKSQIVSKKNKQKIFNIHTQNQLTLEVWEKVFSNAKRGWDIGDRKNVAPALKKILDEWDSFASDDYFLAPDREELKKLQEEKKRQEELARQKQQKKNDEEYQKRLEEYNSISDKKSAFEYLIKHPFARANKELFVKTHDFKEFSRKFNFTLKEFEQYQKTVQIQKESEGLNG